MQRYDIVLTWEAMNDIANIADYIELIFGADRADRFLNDADSILNKLQYMSGMFPKTQLFYRGYVIHKMPFPPSIIFYIMEEGNSKIKFI